MLTQVEEFEHILICKMKGNVVIMEGGHTTDLERLFLVGLYPASSTKKQKRTLMLLDLFCIVLEDALNLK